jgi:hypothetical protein
MLFHSLQGAGGFSSTPSGNPTITYNNSYVVPAKLLSASSITFTSVALGTAASNRVVAVYFSTGSGNAGLVSSVTIQGITATLGVRATNSNSFSNTVIYYATVPTGTTGDVVVTFSTTWGNTTAAYLGCVSMYDLASTTPITAFSFSASDGVSPTASATLTPSADAVLFAGWRAGAVAAGSTSSWTNATEQTDSLSGAVGNTDAISSGLANSSLTVTATNTDTAVNRPALVVATWR